LRLAPTLRSVTARVEVSLACPVSGAFHDAPNASAARPASRPAYCSVRETMLFRDEQRFAFVCSSESRQRLTPLSPSRHLPRPFGRGTPYGSAEDRFSFPTRERGNVSRPEAPSLDRSEHLPKTSSRMLPSPLRLSRARSGPLGSVSSRRRFSPNLLCGASGVPR